MPSYFGIGDKARGANKIYLGVNGVAREVKKMYLGVDGKARLVYPNNTWKKYTISKKYVQVQNNYLYSTFWIENRVIVPDSYTFNSNTGEYTFSQSGNEYSPLVGAWSLNNWGSGPFSNFNAFIRPDDVAYTTLGKTISYTDIHRIFVKTAKGTYPDQSLIEYYKYDVEIQDTQGSYIEDVYDANPNSYPANGKHTDGYWYVKQ